MPYTTRAGQKLAHALDTFGVDVTNLVCADFGCNVGGFTDCLLQSGAAHVHAVDTAYGTLAYPLRIDERVTVHERTNALHAEAPPDGVDLVVIDLGWTPQRHAIPAALRWLRPAGRIISLIKPHYELDAAAKRERLKDGQLSEADAEAVLGQVLAALPEFDVNVAGHTRSPITGRKSGKRGPGNIEFLALLEQR